jgi:GxxExxY protein
MKNPREKHFAPVPTEAEREAKTILDAAFRVQTALGPGLIESIYEACLAHEIRKCGTQVDTQVFIPVIYDGIRMENGLPRNVSS